MFLIMRPGLISTPLIFLLTANSVHCQVTVDFTAPDTVCVGETINITNLSTGGTTYYWSFCSGNTIYNPVGVNIGNPGGILNIPVYITLVKDASGCYSFITCQGSSSLIRYFHGSSFNNNPVSWTNLGSFGIIGDSVEGLSLRYDNSQWIGLVNSNNRIARLNFGNSLANTPTADMLGTYSYWNTAHCIEVLKEAGTWIGYVTCTWGNCLVRLNFGNSLMNTPVLTNLGTVGGILNMPSFFSTFNDNGNWYALVISSGNKLARLAFGNSLLNSPAATDLGQVCGNIPLGGVTLIRDCDSITGFQLNYTANANTANEIFRLNFPNGINGPVTGTGLGNIGGMNKPHGFSEIVRVEDTLFTYVTNRQNFTLTRLSFLSCTNASVGSSNLYNPPPYSYNQAGTYNVHLSVDEGLPTQASLCKSIVVMNPPTMNLGPDTTICQGSSVVLDAGAGFSSYLWSTGATTRTITVNTAGTYWARGTKYGCQVSDTVIIWVAPLNIGFNTPDTVCMGATINITNLTTCGTTYYWSFCTGNTLSNPVGINIGNPGNLLNIPAYIFMAKDNTGCYSFITSGGNSSLIRYFHGSSFNNSPVSWTNLGSFGLLGINIQGLRILYDNGQWIGIINNDNSLVRLNFGASLANTPTADLLGPYSMLSGAHCIELLKVNGSWIGYLTCTLGNKIVRLNFGNSLLNTPVMTDLGTLGGTLNQPCTFSMVQENGNWYAIVVNYGNNTHTRLAFGTSLLNNPTGTNLGQDCGSILLRGLVLIRDCNETAGFQLNYMDNTSTGNELYRLNFPDGFTGPITCSPIGNPGIMNKPNEASQIVRVGDTLYAYVSNRQDYTITRLKFLPCTNASTGSSTQYNPPPFSYNQTGTYNVQLIVDEGLATQASLCKNITVMNPPIIILGPDTSICQGNSVLLDAGAGFNSYLWSTGATTRTITVGTSGSYWVQGVKYGCLASDTVNVYVNPLPFPSLSGPALSCVASGGNTYITQAGMTNYTWSVSPGGTVTSGGTSSSDNVVVTWNTAGLQDVAVNYTDANGCTAEVPAILTVSVQSLPVPTIIGPVSPCIFSDDNIYTTESGMTDYAWNVSSGGLITAGQGTDSVIVKWETAGQQYVSVNYTDQNGCTATESVYYDVTVRPLPDTASGIYGPSVICSPADSLYYSVAPIANAASYVWIMPQDFSVISGSGTSSVTVKVEAGASGGNIYVYGINVCGNGFHSPLFNVVVNNQALANAGPDQATCSGVPFTVSGAIASNYIDIHWISNGTGTLINSSSLSPTYSEGPNETGTVTLSLIATGESPCSNDTSRMILTILSSATVNAGDDLSSCKSSPVVLSDASASAYISLLWTTSGNGIFENPASLNTKYFPGDQDSQTGHVILTLQAYSASPCEPVSDSLTLTLVPGPEVTQGRDSIICQGMSYTVNGIYVNHSSGFYWFTSGHGDFNNTNTLNPTYIPAPDETGSIRLTLNVNGIAACHDSIVKSYTDFFIYPAPLVNAGEDQTIPYDNATSLTCAVSGGSGRYKYIWNPSSLLLDNSLQYPQTISLTKETVFYIIVTDQLTGCSTSDSTWVKVKPQNESEDCIVIHNVITPNGDGLNDTWDIDCIEIFPENSVRIFNRWGDVVNTFENYNNKDIVWEGTNSKGEILPDGTYFYLLNIKNGTTHTGWVFLHSGNR